MKKTVGALIEKDGKVLLMKRNHDPFNGYWGLPGGHVDEGETPEQAVIREVKEETNLDFQPKTSFVTEEHVDEINWHALVTFFTGKSQGEVKISEEHTEYNWFSLEEIEKMELAFDHKKIIRRFKKWNKKKKLM